MSDVNDVVERLIALRDAFRPAPGAGPQTVGLEGYRALVTGNTLAAIYDACALINTLASRLAEAERRAERLSAVILWALGEGDEFPMRPDDWETRKYKPWYWWRGELRKRYDAALSPRHQSAEGAEGEGT